MVAHAVILMVALLDHRVVAASEPLQKFPTILPKAECWWTGFVSMIQELRFSALEELHLEELQLTLL